MTHSTPSPTTSTDSLQRVDRQRRLDRWVGIPICALLSLWSRWRQRSVPPTPKAILIVLLSEMGSLMLAAPMFEKLQETYPGARLHVLMLAKNRHVLRIVDAARDATVITIRDAGLLRFALDSVSAIRRMNRLHIDTVIDCELFSRISAIFSYCSGAGRRVGFDRYTMEGLYRGRMVTHAVPYNPHRHISHQFLAMADAIDQCHVPAAKFRVPEGLPALRQRAMPDSACEAMRHRLTTDFPGICDRPLVLLYPGGGLLPERAWPESHYQSLARSLISRGAAVAVIGLRDDRDLAQRIIAAVGVKAMMVDLTGYTHSLEELLALFHLAQALVTNDGGPGHFAAVTPVRSFVFFGPETPVLYRPLSDRCVVYYESFGCSPCLTAYNHRRTPCDGDNRCMAAIAPETVLEDVSAALHLPGRADGST